MIVGYARCSTDQQIAGFEAQVRDLTAAGCERVFQEQVSSVAKRDELAKAVGFLQKGDMLCVTKLDRLARSVKHLIAILETLEHRGAALRILNLGGQSVDTVSATGKLMLNLLVSFAQFEREMMLERQREGIARAKRDGKYRGRKPTARLKSAAVVDYKKAGVHPLDIAEKLDMSVVSVYRILRLSKDRACAAPNTVVQAAP